MRKTLKSIVVVLLLIMLVLASGVAVFAHGWDLKSAEEVSGVSGTISFKRPGGFTLTANTGKEYKLLMHPLRFLEETGLKISGDDRIAVAGLQVDEGVIMVTSITKGSETYVIAEPEDFDRRAMIPGKRGPWARGPWQGEPGDPGRGPMMDRYYPHGPYPGQRWQDDRFRRGHCW